MPDSPRSRREPSYLLAEIAVKIEVMSAKVEVISPLQEHEFIDTCYELASASHFWFEWRFRSFLRQVKSLEVPLTDPLRVLDVGAGNGVVREQVESATEWIVDITDLDHGALESAKPGRGKTFYYDIMEKRPEWADRYDAMILFDVLEHIENTQPFLDAILFHLKPGGFLFVNVPALQILFSRYDEVQGHFRRYTTGGLKAEFAKQPVTVADARYWGWMNVPLLLTRRVLLDRFSSGQTDEEIYRRGCAPPMPAINRAFLAMMNIETRLPATVPTGSSVLLAARKLTQEKLKT